jgi:hypothetical protein
MDPAMKAAIIAGCVVLSVLCAAPGAHATADGCAVVKRTSDGFVNLRKDPSMRARIVARLKPGQIVYVDDLACAPMAHCDNEGGWTHVTGVPASRECATKYMGDRLDNQLDYERCLKRAGLRDDQTVGWVGTRFIAHVDCESLEAPTKGMGPT